jgi:hypothetical protein
MGRNCFECCTCMVWCWCVAQLFLIRLVLKCMGPVTKLQIGANLALPASCLCVCMQLARIASVSHARSTRTDKLRGALIDITICWFVPMIYMALRMCTLLLHTCIYEMLFRLYRAGSPLWYSRRFWLSTNHLRVHRCYLYNLGPPNGRGSSDNGLCWFVPLPATAESKIIARL